MFDQLISNLAAVRKARVSNSNPAYRIIEYLSRDIPILFVSSPFTLLLHFVYNFIYVGFWSTDSLLGITTEQPASIFESAFRSEILLSDEFPGTIHKLGAGWEWFRWEHAANKLHFSRNNPTLTSFNRIFLYITSRITLVLVNQYYHVDSETYPPCSYSISLFTHVRRRTGIKRGTKVFEWQDGSSFAVWKPYKE